jgi:hypothetical protein
MLYLVINLDTEEKGIFTTARDLAVFMWGRDCTRYALYRCARQPWPSGSIVTIEKVLEAML